MCFLCIFSLCSRVKLLLFLISLTVHRKTNFLVNLYRDNKYSDSDSDSVHFTGILSRKHIEILQYIGFPGRLSLQCLKQDMCTSLYQ